MDLTFKNNKALYFFIIALVFVFNYFASVPSAFAAPSVSPTRAVQDLNTALGVSYVNTNVDLDNILILNVVQPNDSRSPATFYVFLRKNSSATTPAISVNSSQQLIFGASSSSAPRYYVLTYTNTGASMGSLNKLSNNSTAVEVVAYGVTSFNSGTSSSPPVDPKPEAEKGWWESISSVDGLKDTVTGWIGDTLSFLVTPLTYIGDAISFVSEQIGKQLIDLYESTLDGFKSIGTFISDLSSSMGQYFSDLGSSFVDGLNDLYDGLAKFLDDIWKTIKSIFSSLDDLLDYINPFSDKFILKIAFIPEEGYLEDKLDDLKYDLERRFAFIDQINDSMKSVTKAVSSQKFEGWKITLPYVDKELQVVNPYMINEIMPKLRYFLGGVMVITTFIYLIRRGGRVIGAGKG